MATSFVASLQAKPIDAMGEVKSIPLTRLSREMPAGIGLTTSLNIRLSSMPRIRIVTPPEGVIASFPRDSSDYSEVQTVPSSCADLRKSPVSGRYTFGCPTAAWLGVFRVGLMLSILGDNQIIPHYSLPDESRMATGRNARKGVAGSQYIHGGVNAPMKRNKLTPFGLLAKKRMIDIDMAHGELAERIGCGANYLCAIFNGQRSGAKYEAAIRKELGLGDTPAMPMGGDSECKRNSA